MQLEWGVFYDNGSLVTNLDGEHWNLPRRGVQVVIEGYPAIGWVKTNKRVDFYIYDPEWERPKWRTTSDLFGLWDHMSNTGMKVILFGGFISDRHYNEVCIKATEWARKHFGQKSESLLYEE